MKNSKWIGICAAVLLVISCFSPWVSIPSKNIIISGVDATGTNFGKPGYFHLFLVFFFIIFHLLPKIWAKRVNLLVAGLNTAWAIRNFFLIAACMGGECPERKSGIYLLLFSSMLMLLSSFFPQMKIQSPKK